MPIELFPNEYGGSAGPLNEIAADFRERIESQRTYLMNPTNWVVKGLKTDGTIDGNYDDDNASKSKDN